MDELETAVSQRVRIDSELHIAREIQMGMLPKIFPPFPNRDDIDLYAQLIPAREVGGDLYDFFILDEQLYLVIGDVSGKGVPASLLMAVTRSLFRSTAPRTNDPARIVGTINDSISETNDSNMFVTLFVGILNLKTGLLRYCNAGHNPPVLVCKGTETAFIGVKPHIPVGICPGFDYTEQELHLPSGALLFLYTDGLTEAENSAGELFSEPRLLAALERHGTESARELTLSMRQTVAEYAGETEQSDDLTLLALRFRPLDRTSAGVLPAV